MKKELIKTPEYLLVVDETLDIAENNWTLKDGVPREVSYLGQDNGHRIIYHLPLGDSPIIEGVPLLPPFEVEGDVEKLGNEFSNAFALYLSRQLVVALNEGFKAGYNKAKETYKFTEKQIDVAIDSAIKKGREGDVTITDIDNLIQSLSQPKMPTHFEFEMVNFEVDMGLGDECIEYSQYPKTTTNSQGQQVACGKYVYEL